MQPLRDVLANYYGQARLSYIFLGAAALTLAAGLFQKSADNFLARIGVLGFLGAIAYWTTHTAIVMFAFAAYDSDTYTYYKTQTNVAGAVFMIPLVILVLAILEQLYASGKRSVTTEKHSL